jgi:Family of unknown function (DUF6499)
MKEITKSFAPLDWRNPFQYPNPQTATMDSFAWEFLRRNSTYQAEFRRRCEIVMVLASDSSAASELHELLTCDPTEHLRKIREWRGSDRGNENDFIHEIDDLFHDQNPSFKDDFPEFARHNTLLGVTRFDDNSWPLTHCINPRYTAIEHDRGFFGATFMPPPAVKALKYGRTMALSRELFNNEVREQAEFLPWSIEDRIADIENWPMRRQGFAYLEVNLNFRDEVILESVKREIETAREIQRENGSRKKPTNAETLVQYLRILDARETSPRPTFELIAEALSVDPTTISKAAIRARDYVASDFWLLITGLNSLGREPRLNGQFTREELES